MRKIKDLPDLTPEEKRNLAEWLAGFFQACDHSPELRQMFLEHPGRAMETYRRHKNKVR